MWIEQAICKKEDSKVGCWIWIEPVSSGTYYICETDCRQMAVNSNVTNLCIYLIFIDKTYVEHNTLHITQHG